MIRFFPLTPKQRSPFEQFTYPAYRARLACASKRTVVIGVVDNHDPIGLGLAEIRCGGTAGDILSLFTARRHRKQGVATQLMKSLEQELGTQGCRQAELVYMSGLPSTPAIEKILRKQEWQLARPRMIICHSNASAFRNARWFQHTHFPTDYSPVSWAELTSEDRRSILDRQRERNWYPEVLSPFPEEGSLAPFNSIGLRYKGEIVGWMITHRVGSDTIRYSRLFVAEQHRKLGRTTIALLGASIRQHFENVESCGARSAMWSVAFENEPMIRFVQRHLSPYLSFSQTTWETVKTL